jgi:hypothetical protein
VTSAFGGLSVISFPSMTAKSGRSRPCYIDAPVAGALNFSVFYKIIKSPYGFGIRIRGWFTSIKDIGLVCFVSGSGVSPIFHVISWGVVYECHFISRLCCLALIGMNTAVSQVHYRPPPYLSRQQVGIQVCQPLRLHGHHLATR